MINIYDDHDIIDGFGSYPSVFMNCPVFSNLGKIAFKYYILFQHQMALDEDPSWDKSLIMGLEPGPYMKERSRSISTWLGKDVYFLGSQSLTFYLSLIAKGSTIAPNAPDIGLITIILTRRFSVKSRPMW